MGASAYLWAKIRSWHLTPATVPADSPPGVIRTLCGLYAPDDVARQAEPPNGEKTCETCFRVRESDGA